MKRNTEQEIWKDVAGYEGLYEVSNQGRVRSLDRLSANGRRIKGVVLRPAPNSKGYLSVCLHSNGDGGTSLLVHRLVAEAFLSTSEKPQINHKNGNKLDNRAGNLEWCTSLENVRHSLKNGLRSSYLTIDQVRAIRFLAACGVQQKKLARLYHISRSTVSVIVRRKTWKHI